MKKRIIKLLNRYEDERTFFFSACEECVDITSQPYVLSLFDGLLCLKITLERMFPLWPDCFDSDVLQRFNYMRIHFDSVERVYSDYCKKISNLRSLAHQGYSQAHDLF